MINLFIAVVLEGYASISIQQIGIISQTHYQELIHLWMSYDTKATGWIQLKDLIFLIYELSEPLGRAKEY
jgi:hypothetical protein